MIKIRLDIRLSKSSNFVHPQDCLGYSWLFVFIKIYNQLFLNLREGSKGGMLYNNLLVYIQCEKSSF